MFQLHKFTLQQMLGCTAFSQMTFKFISESIQPFFTIYPFLPSGSSNEKQPSFAMHFPCDDASQLLQIQSMFGGRAVGILVTLV